MKKISMRGSGGDQRIKASQVHRLYPKISFEGGTTPVLGLTTLRFKMKNTNLRFPKNAARIQPLEKLQKKTI